MFGLSKETDSIHIQRPQKFAENTRDHGHGEFVRKYFVDVEYG